MSVSVGISWLGNGLYQSESFYHNNSSNLTELRTVLTCWWDQIKSCFDLSSVLTAVIVGFGFRDDRLSVLHLNTSDRC